jgi:hypothetical protein
LLKFKLGHFPPSVVSLIHSAAAYRSGRQARVQNAGADADRHAAGRRLLAATSGQRSPASPRRRALLRAGAAKFSASGLKRQDNDLIVIESAGAAASFKRNFDARFASGEALSAG